MQQHNSEFFVEDAMSALQCEDKYDGADLTTSQIMELDICMTYGDMGNNVGQKLLWAPWPRVKVAIARNTAASTSATEPEPLVTSGPTAMRSLGLRLRFQCKAAVTQDAERYGPYLRWPVQP